MRFAKYSPSHTKAAKFRDRRSRVGVRPDGSLRYDLEGRDKTALRDAVFERDHWTCAEQNPRSEWFMHYGTKCAGKLDLSHEPPMSTSAGSDEESTTVVRCRRHHRSRDGHGEDLHF